MEINEFDNPKFIYVLKAIPNVIFIKIYGPYVCTM